MPLPWAKIGYDPSPPEPTVDTFYSSSADGGIQSAGATYSTARNGTNLVVRNTVGDREAPGQVKPGDYYLEQAFFSFDTSSIPDTNVITAVEFSLYGSNIVTIATHSTVEARIHDWGATLTAEDWVDCDDLGSKTLVATLATTSYVNNDRNVFTSDAAFVNNINKTGTTYIMLSTDRMRTASAPTNEERVGFNHREASADPTYQPRLIVTHHA